jgi:hypothetical protein
MVLDLADALELSHSDTDRLLFSATYSPEYGTQEPDLEAGARIEEAWVERMVVDQLEVTGAPQRPPAPLRTRVPKPRAPHLVGRLGIIKLASRPGRFASAWFRHRMQVSRP